MRRAHHHLDPSAKRVYGPLWKTMCEVVDLHPHTSVGGVLTIVGLCSEATVEELALFTQRLSRPLPGRGETAARWLEHHLPTCGAADTAGFDEGLLLWGRQDEARRIWAVVALTWGLSANAVTAAFDELVAVGSHPRALDAPNVVALATAPPRRIPEQLLRRHGLDDVCAEIAADTGVRAGDIGVTLPAALSAIAAGMADDPVRGVAACGLLIRSQSVAGVDPAHLEQAAREGTPAATLARLLARLWSSLHAHAGHVPGPDEQPDPKS